MSKKTQAAADKMFREITAKQIQTVGMRPEGAAEGGGGMKRVWSVRDTRTGMLAQFGEVTSPDGIRYVVLWADEGSRFTDDEAIVAIAFVTLFAERFGHKQAHGRFVAQEVARG